MERDNDYDNDGLDPSEEYFEKKKVKMMMIPISPEGRTTITNNGSR